MNSADPAQRDAARAQHDVTKADPAFAHAY
jgi:hypothetical protein